MSNRAFQDITPGTKFWMLLVQAGEGCDYTVGCGMCARPLKSSTLEDARAEAKVYFEGSHYVDPKSETVLSHVVLITGSEFLLLNQWKMDYTAAQAAKETEQRQVRDLMELDRLQKLYGKRP